MKVWLCPVKPRSWRIIKNTKLFGVPKTGLKTISLVRPGDLLIFHVLKPVNGIVAIAKVISEVFEDHQDIWGRHRYPFRIKIEFNSRFIKNEKECIPLRILFGKIQGKEDIWIEPYLKNIWITQISNTQYQKLKNHFKENPSNSYTS
jgi:predicted RNA-binding protein